MKEFDTNNTFGELWIRNLNGEKVRASQALSSVYLKYKGEYPIFYNELITNKVNRFDVFYDCIFIQTPSGSIFEKLIPSDNGFEPYNLNDLYTAQHDSVAEYASFDTHVDYWFDEKNQKVIYAQIVALEENRYFRDFFTFVLLVNEFNCKTASLKTIIFDS